MCQYNNVPMWQYANWLRYVEDIKQIGAFLN